jgi:very-short-patch-repair endonuclease
VLDLYDAGAASPKETWLRLLAIRAGYPRPRTQIPVLSADGRRRYYLDMGWEHLMLALEYDGEQHRTDPIQYAYDIQRSEDLDELGWTQLRVVKANTAADVLCRLERVWRSKLRGDRNIS